MGQILSETLLNRLDLVLMFKEYIEELLHFESVIKIGAALTFVLQFSSGPLISRARSPFWMSSFILFPLRFSSVSFFSSLLAVSSPALVFLRTGRSSLSFPLLVPCMQSWFWKPPCACYICVMNDKFSLTLFWIDIVI